MTKKRKPIKKVSTLLITIESKKGTLIQSMQVDLTEGNRIVLEGLE